MVGPFSKTFIPVRTFVLAALGLILFLDAADAYTLSGVPCPWLGMFLAGPLIVVYALFSRLSATPGISLYLILLLWMLGNTAIMNMYVDYANMMPALATTTYPTFLFLRGYSFFGFLFLSIVVYNYARSGSPQKLLDLIAILGVLVTAYAIYVLIAQRLSLPMLPKTRFGTGEGGAIAGGESGYFGDSNEQYLFRTIGSFREPSFLGIWLVLPFFFSIAAAGGKLLNWRTVVIGLGILSTGSLTAAVAVVFAFIAALQLVKPLSKRGFQILAAVVAVACVLGVTINFVAQIYFITPDGYSFADQYLLRLERIASGGVQHSNRSQAFDRFLNSEFTLAGLGMGNAHLEYSQRSHFVVSFLSLYFHVWFAGGAIGLSILAIYLLLPLLGTVLRWRYNRFDDVWYVAAYLAWLVVFVVNDESLNVMCSVAIGVLWSRVDRRPALASEASHAPPPGRPAAAPAE